MNDRVPETVPFGEYTDGLAAGARATDGVKGIVLLGSASRSAAARRDGWSDHDFYALFEPGRERELRRTLPFLPRPEHVVLVAGEGGDGFSVLYDDGHLLEFGCGTTAEFAAAKFAEHEILVADDDVTEWAAAAARRGAAFTAESAMDAAGLTLAKLLIGYGRAARGEVISGGAFVRGAAVSYLTLAVRHRLAPATEDRDPFDPTRRFERDYPDLSRRIAEALEAPVTDAARQLLEILRSALEPGWPEFPSAAADIVAARFR